MNFSKKQTKVVLNLGIVVGTSLLFYSCAHKPQANTKRQSDPRNFKDYSLYDPSKDFEAKRYIELGDQYRLASPFQEL